MLEIHSMKKLQEYVRRKVARNDPAHDFEHITRVYNNAKRLARKEHGNTRLVLAAALLHDIISYPKSYPRSKSSSEQSATQASKVLPKYGYTKDEIKIISDAIRDHSFSRGTTPSTLTGKLLQDADRLDAIGSIGIARAFSVGGAERRQFYNNKDPFCKTRIPDDKKWTLDHFYKKLLPLEKNMNMRSARLEARRRIRVMRQFLHELKSEI